MKTTTTEGSITSLHLHPETSGQTIQVKKKCFGFTWTSHQRNPMRSVQTMTLVANKGILGNTRYYDTKNKSTGYPNRNHVSLIEIERISDCADTMCLENIQSGIALSNIETADISLMDLIGCEVKIGATAVLYFYKARVPCYRMDQITPGLQQLMKNNQGVIAEIITSGEIKIGDPIRINSSEFEPGTEIEF